MDTQKAATFFTRNAFGRTVELRNKHTGRRVRALLPVHILGHTVDLDPILELGRQFNLPVIEDATECLGARYKGRRPAASAISGSSALMVTRSSPPAAAE